MLHASAAVLELKARLLMAISSRAFYANFPRRLNAISIDTLLLLAFVLLIVGAALLVEKIVPARVGLMLTMWAVVLFYEPVLVWRTGGTIGHHAMNLRVVDNRTLGNVSFPKALARFFLKTLLGIVSFLTMQFSRRHQAVHDIATGSSLRIRDPRTARTHHYTLGPE